MTSLPEEFAPDAESVPMTDRNIYMEPPIRAGKHERVSRGDSNQRNVSPGIALPIAVLALSISVLVLSIAVDHPLQSMVAMFGGKKTVTASPNTEFTVQLETLSATLKEASEKSDQAINGARLVTQDIESLRTQLRDADGRQTNLENRVIQMNSKLEAMTARPAQKSVVVKPKAPVVKPILMNVVSIRNQGGVVWTSLREGLDTSPLLTVGDEWRTFKVISIDTTLNGVQIASNGNVITVKL